MLHFDRNALRSSVRLPDSLIALTFSGVLMRFDLPEIRLVRERAGSREVTCLGAGKGGEILAGLGDGRICRVDPTTLELTEVAKLQAAPVWIGWGQAAGKRPAGLVVVTRPTRPFERGVHWGGPYAVVNDIVTGKTYALEGDRSTFFLDGESRLWLGADNGEFNGKVTRVDLIKETISEIAPPPSPEFDEKKAEPAKKKEGSEPSKKKEVDEEEVVPEEKLEPSWEGICGFIQLKDGQVWAFGGTSHMGINSGNIIRVDEGKPRPLFAIESGLEPEKPGDRDRPRFPITHIIEGKDDLFVVSYSDIFRVDRSLKHWRKTGNLPTRHHSGRPDLMDPDPSVRDIHLPARNGEPYIFAALDHGYVVQEGTKSISRRIPGQLNGWGACGVENSSEGILVTEIDGRYPLWKLGAKGWEVDSLAPPFLDPANKLTESERQDSDWYETQVLIGPGGAIYTVSGARSSNGTRITARRVAGKTLRLGQEATNLYPSSSFITADGTLWNSSSEDLKRFEDGGWKVVVHLSRRENVPYNNWDWGMPSRLEPINQDRPPWLLRDHSDRNLWRLDPGMLGVAPHLDRVEVKEADKPLKIDAAISWSDGALLLATDRGLRKFDPVARKLSKVDIQDPPRPVRTLTRDGLGRLWIGTDKGLQMLEIGGKILESFDEVPLVWNQYVSAVSPDPEHEDGVIAALGLRGVAFLRAFRKP